MPQIWPMTSRRVIVTSQYDVTPKLILNPIWFSLTRRNYIFVWLTKTATGLVLTVTPVNLQLGDDKQSIYLIKRESGPNTSYFLTKSHFSKSNFFKLAFNTLCILSLTSEIFYDRSRNVWYLFSMLKCHNLNLVSPCAYLF